MRNISANTLQVLGNQSLSVFIFLFISRSFDKPSFGELSWSLAVLTLITTLLSLRLEQIVIRNVAAGNNPSGMLTLLVVHNLFSGLIFFAVLSAVCYLYPSFAREHYLLWILSISQILTFWALPFRQLLSGRGDFGWLALLASVSNIIRAIGLYGCMIYSLLSIQIVLLLFTVSALIELLLGVWIVSVRLGIRVKKMDFVPEYRGLIISSMPQVGVVFLQAGIARVDWILMGLLSTPAHTAEYAFAYRAFELAPLPLLVLAPLLLNKMARERSADALFLDRLVRLELLLATLPTLWLVLSWSPMVDLFTAFKYGASNAWTFLILSCCIPFQYVNNLYWSQEFARDRLSLIFSVTAVTGVVVLAGDLILIPRYAGAGAAIAYLTAMIAQYILYTRASDLEKKWEWARRLLLSLVIATGSGLIATGLTDLLWLQLLLCTALYCILGWATGLLRTKETVLLWRAGLS
jgi:O-antigen/teichoic acid export membrane protein